MSTCTFTPINGANKDCLDSFFAASKGFAITKPDFKFTTKAAAAAFENWRVGIEENLNIFMTMPLKNAETTDTELVEETDGFGVMYNSAMNPPRMIAHMDSNPCDFNQWVSAGSQTVRVFGIGEDGTKRGWINSSGQVYGFKAQMVARPVGLQGADQRGAATAQYQLYLNFKDVNEFKNGVQWNDGITYDQYIDEVPVGYTQEITTAIAADGTMDVKIYKRCDEATLSADTWTYEIIESNNCTDPNITVGALSSGISELTFNATGITPIDETQWIKYRLVVKTGSIYDKMTNVLTAYGVSA